MSPALPRYRLLAVDIDGTLVNQHDELSGPTCEALKRAGRAGVRVVLATGRRYSRSLHLVAPLGIRVPLITASGALVKDPTDHRTLYRAEFDRELLCDLLAWLDGHGYEPLLYGDTFTEGFDYYLASAEVRSRELAEYLRLNPDCGRIRPRMIADPPPEIFAGFVMGTHEAMLALERRLHEALPNKLHTHVLRSPRYAGYMCELAPAGVTKWSAVQRLARQWQIPEAAICAVGDDVNDIPMIRAAGLGVAMGNALAPVKAAADRIAPSQAEDGLAAVVGWLLNGADEADW